VSVRIARAEDAGRTTAIINAAFRLAESFFIDTDRIDIDGVQELLITGQFLVADQDGEILGCVYLEPRGERSYLGLLAIDPGQQQNGLGSMLMDAAENHLRQRGFRFIDLNVVSLREELFGFYRRRGYVETGASPFPEDVETKLPVHFIEMSKRL